MQIFSDPITIQWDTTLIADAATAVKDLSQHTTLDIQSDVATSPTINSPTELNSDVSMFLRV